MKRNSTYTQHTLLHYSFSPRRSSLFLLLTLFCVLSFAAGNAFSESLDSMKRVLVLNSYHPGYVWGESVNDGLRSVFDSSEINVNIRYEYMDTKHLRPEVIFKRLRELFLIKYQRFQFDTIIATDNNALNFLLLYRDELFPDTPVIFCGINGYQDSMLEGQSGFTGFAENSDLRGTLEMALALHPKTKYVALVSGTSTSSLINQDRMRAIIPDYADRVKLIDLSRLNPEELARRLQRLPEETIIIYLSYYKMEDGTFLTVKESTSFVFDNSGLPIYSPWEYTMGYGIIGGMMLSGEKEGQRAAYYALKMLSGTPLEELPVDYDSDISPIFDFNMLRQFHLSRSDLPVAAVIKNEPQTIYYRYKYWIWALVGFIVYQTVTILWLTQSLIRRKRAEKQQKKLEAQLLHSQKMEAIGTFAGGIAHDLNNILGAIGNCSEIALEDTSDEDPVKEDLHHIINATNRGKSLIRQILDFSRKQDNESRSIDMKTMVLECMNLLKQVIPPSIETRVEITEDSCCVYANAAKIHQVIMNLCTNAEQAMRGSNGTLTIRLDRETVDFTSPLLTQELQPGSYVKLTVADSGCGMSEELQRRIFEPFFTTRTQTEGTGLGLAVVHGIITSYGGGITVVSSPGKGCTFRVYLPLGEEQQDLQLHVKDEQVPKGNEAILLVDDDADILYASRKLLVRAGYQVSVFTSSIEALKEYCRKPERFHLLITDQVMPQMTGVELIKECRKKRRDLPTLLCSGHRDNNLSMINLKKEEIENFIQKPFTSTDYLTAIRKILDNSHQL